MPRRGWLDRDYGSARPHVPGPRTECPQQRLPDPRQQVGAAPVGDPVLGLIRRGCLNGGNGFVACSPLELALLVSEPDLAYLFYFACRCPTCLCSPVLPDSLT